MKYLFSRLEAADTVQSYIRTLEKHASQKTQMASVYVMCAPSLVSELHLNVLISLN